MLPARAARLVLAFAVTLLAASSAIAQSTGYRTGSAAEFTGEWQFTTPDGTSGENLTLSVRGTDVVGAGVAFERGYYSGRTTVKARVAVRGTLSNGALELRIAPEGASPDAAIRASGRLRGEYFILVIDGAETGYARPGRDLVRDAQGSAEATAFTRTIAGRVYSTSTQAGRRDGAIVGGRTRLALCTNGQVEYDFSDVGSVPDGGSMGSTVARRGQWTVVLYAGAPTVMARWNGSGSSYSLTRFFAVRPDASGRSARVDGKDLAVTDRC